MARQGTGWRVFSTVSIILSVLVLLLAAAGIIVTWVVYNPVIDGATGVLTGIEQLAQASQEGVNRLETRVTAVREQIGEIETAIDQLAQNVADRGLVLTLLPPEKEQELEAAARQLDEAVTSVQNVVQAAIALREAVATVPLVDLPEPDPEQVTTIEAGVGAIQEGVNDLEADIRRFREDTSGEISQLSATAAAVNDRLGVTQQNLAQLDTRLAALEAGANQLKQRISTLVTIVAVVNTALFGWTIYAMVVVIRQAWSELRT